MLRATLKSLFARKLRLILTALAVVLGVGMTAGSFILTDTALKSFDNLFGDVYKGTDVVVQGTTAFESSGQNNTGGGSERQPIPASVLPKVEAVDGVAAADGSIGGTAWIVDPATNKVIQNGGAPPIGGSWDAAITTLQIDPGGAPPVGPDQVVIDAATAADHGIAVGQQIKVVTTNGPGEFTVSGIAHFGSSNSLLGATLAAVRSAHRAEALRSRGRVRHDLREGRRERRSRPAREPGRVGPAEGVRVDHRRDGREPAAGPGVDGPWVPADVLPDLRVRRAVRGRVHHLQHVQHRGVAAHPGAGAVPRARGEPPSGAHLGAA